MFNQSKRKELEAEENRARARLEIDGFIESGLTRIAAELATASGLEGEYPDLIRQYDAEQEQLHGTREAVDRLAETFPLTGKAQ